MGGQFVNGEVIFNLPSLEHLEIRDIKFLSADINKLTKLKKLCITVRDSSCLVPLEEKTINALESCFLVRVKLPHKSSSLVSIGDYLISPTEEELFRLLAELVDSAYVEYNFMLCLMNKLGELNPITRVNLHGMSRSELIVKAKAVLELEYEPTLAAQNIRIVLDLLSKRD